MIAKSIKIKNNILPDQPGVYLMKNAAGEIIYIGKATSLKSRVSSYWNNAHDRKTEKMVSEVKTIDYRLTDTVIEALLLEANLVKKYQPKYNIDLKDDKSWLSVCITKEAYPRVLLKREYELQREDRRVYKKIFGPFTNAAAVRAALDIVRKIFPYSTCQPPHPSPLPRGEGNLRACFDYHIGHCRGVCIGTITPREYGKIIRNIILFLSGKKNALVKKLERDMRAYARREQFEEAARVRGEFFAIAHINDVAVLKREDVNLSVGDQRHPEFISGSPTKNSEMLKRACPGQGSGVQHDTLPNATINIYGRIEGYDISNISGTSATGSMVVFLSGEPSKNEYRKFKIKTVRGSNDYAMLREVLRRRFNNAWLTPDIILVDGGWGQVHVAQEILDETGHVIPIVGIAKGIDRKKDELIFDAHNLELARIAEQFKHILVAVRDEAHRFAVKYHRELRSRRR